MPRTTYIPRFLHHQYWKTVLLLGFFGRHEGCNKCNSALGSYWGSLIDGILFYTKGLYTEKKGITSTNVQR